MIHEIERPFLPCLDTAEYSLAGLASLPTPRLVVFRKYVEENIRLMRSYLEGVAPGTGFEHLRTHVKTHKSAWTTRLLHEAGVRRFKCCPHELEMLVDAGAEDIFVAYPLLPRDADLLARRMVQFPRVRFIAQIGNLIHAEYLAAAARRHNVEIPVLIDVDVGSHRTGAPPQAVADLARAVARESRLAPLRLEGIHAYDGYNHFSDPVERRAASHEAMGVTVDCLREVEKVGVTASTVCVAGTPPFIEDLDELVNVHKVDAQVEVSPGTWIYWDTGYDRILPGKFKIAALVFAQVMDRPPPREGEGELITLNLGHKGWSIDHGPVELFSLPGLEFVSANEEHTVMRTTEDTPRVTIGDPILIAPQHVCPTVNLWETFAVVGTDGTLENASEPVTSRNR